MEERRRRPLTAKEKKQLEKQRKLNAKQAKKFHKKQGKADERAFSMVENEPRRATIEYDERPQKRDKKVIKKKKDKKAENITKTNSKIINAVNAQKKERFEDYSREEKFRIESEEKIQKLEPQDFDDGGYYVDEFSARQRQERRARQIREQEKEVIRRPKKPVNPKQIKRKRIIIYSSIFLAVLIICVVLSLTVLFKTEKIDVQGDEYYYKDQIVAFSNVQLEQNIFIAAIGSTPKQIIDNLPYVEDAKVGFNIPDTVTITIKNAVPSYVIKNGDSYLVVSSKGRILESVADNSKGLPELKSDDLKTTEVGKYVDFSDKNVPEILENVSESLRENEVTDVKGFDITNPANIALNYDNRIEIKLGLPEDINYKIKTAMTIINEKLDPNNTKTIAGTLDVSACNTSKISRYKPAETTAPPATQPTTTAAENSGNTTTDNSSSYEWVPDNNYDYNNGANYNDNNYYDPNYYNNDSNYYDNNYYNNGADNGYNNDVNNNYSDNVYGYDNGGYVAE